MVHEEGNRSGKDFSRVAFHEPFSRLLRAASVPVQVVVPVGVVEEKDRLPTAVNANLESCCVAAQRASLDLDIDACAFTQWAYP